MKPDEYLVFFLPFFMPFMFGLKPLTSTSESIVNDWAQKRKKTISDLSVNLKSIILLIFYGRFWYNAMANWTLDQIDVCHFAVAISFCVCFLLSWSFSEEQILNNNIEANDQQSYRNWHSIFLQLNQHQSSECMSVCMCMWCISHNVKYTSNSLEHSKQIRTPRRCEAVSWRFFLFDSIDLHYDIHPRTHIQTHKHIWDDGKPNRCEPFANLLILMLLNVFFHRSLDLAIVYLYLRFRLLDVCVCVCCIFLFWSCRWSVTIVAKKKNYANNFDIE